MFDIGPRNFSSLIFFLLDHAISSVASALLDGHDMTKLSEMRRKKHTTERERQALKVINRSYFQSGERESSTSSHSRCNIFNSHSREFSSCVDFEEKITKFTFCSFTYRLYHFKVYRFIVGFVFALEWQVFVEHDWGGEEGGDLFTVKSFNSNTVSKLVWWGWKFARSLWFCCRLNEKKLSAVETCVLSSRAEKWNWEFSKMVSNRLAFYFLFSKKSPSRSSREDEKKNWVSCQQLSGESWERETNDRQKHDMTRLQK